MIPFELATIFAQLQTPEQRCSGASALAAYSGARQVSLYSSDKQGGYFDLAPGMPQERPKPGLQDFLRRCAGGSASATLPDPEHDSDTPAWGISDPEGRSILVFLGQGPSQNDQRAIDALLPLLSAKLAAEIGLRGADRRKDEFLAMLAHELRNPLAPISMAAHMLKMGPTNMARLEQTCEIIDRQVTHMTNLLDDLLDVSRVTGGKVVLDKTLLDLRHIADQALEQARPLINARQHHLTLNFTQNDATVCGDSTRLVQIVSNLLNNAARYTAPGGDIGMTIARDGEQVVLTVRDTGIGIAPALLPHVFDLFIQGEREVDRAQGGLGLGLALVRSLAQRHGGEVTARSRGLGKGSEFEVRLPHAGESGAIRVAPEQQASSDALDILIVDDNEDAACTLADYLGAHGHQARYVTSATAALADAANDPPRVLVLDIGLPDMDGYALARRLRAGSATRDCVYIALTGYGGAEARERSREAGFDYHLTKPVSGPQLLALFGKLAPRATH
jgi:signal transduction histidine kinase/ActR/RegA family two-component response regulator